mmetsp:Transcript_74899/g.173626  ORF Transcript_74899/g.173626 Transcript_74899/m.173626 type:complete len:266 (+) Transcript_74899:44-841(+)
MAPSRARCALLAALAGALALGVCGPSTVLFRDPEVEGGGAARTARKVRAVQACARFIAQHHAEAVGHNYDTNAMGESWGVSAMSHWVDRAAAPAERLEKELVAMRIGRCKGTHGHRGAMLHKRELRQRELLRQRRHPKAESGNAMLHWADRPAALESPAILERELAAMTVGRVAGNEGARQLMRLRRLARARELAGRRASKSVAPPPRGPPAPGGLAVTSSHYDTNALAEGFRARSAGEPAWEHAQRLEQELADMEIGRRTKGKR